MNRHALVFSAAALLMIVRVDFWWWGDPSPALVFGWLTVPMLYQLGIWLGGWALVLYTASHLWRDSE